MRRLELERIATAIVEAVVEARVSGADLIVENAVPIEVKPLRNPTNSRSAS